MLVINIQRKRFLVNLEAAQTLGRTTYKDTSDCDTTSYKM
jgi:hypothetical protein